MQTLTNTHERHLMSSTSSEIMSGVELGLVLYCMVFVSSVHVA